MTAEGCQQLMDNAQCPHLWTKRVAVISLRRWRALQAGREARREADAGAGKPDACTWLNHAQGRGKGSP